MKSINERIKENPRIGWVIFFVTLLVVFAIGMFASSIMERRTEAAFAYKPAVISISLIRGMQSGAPIFRPNTRVGLKLPIPRSGACLTVVTRLICWKKIHAW